MKNLLFMVLGSTLLVSPLMAQSANDISLAEFRQTLTDYISLADQYRGTNYAPLMAAVPDSTLAQWYKGVTDGRQFQQGVSSLKSSMEARRNSTARRGLSRPAIAASPAPRHPTAAAQSNVSSPMASGVSSTPVPDYTLYPPNYPSGANWDLMTDTLQGLGYVPSGDASDKGCDNNDEANLAMIVGTFKGVHDAADQICKVIPDTTVIAFGEGVKIPAKEICYGVNLIIGAFNSAFEGFEEDCKTQGDLVDGAHIQATYNNSIGLYNLEFRLIVEEDLGSTASPMGLFELPGSQGGYLENVRAIANDIITNMQYAGVGVASAQTALAAGDTYYNSKSYKLAFKQYQKAYGLAVQ